MPTHRMLTSRIVHLRPRTSTDPDPVINYPTATLCSQLCHSYIRSSDTPGLRHNLWYINCSTLCTFVNSNIDLDSILYLASRLS